MCIDCNLRRICPVCVIKCHNKHKVIYEGEFTISCKCGNTVTHC